MVIETLTFRLAPGTDEAAFVDADRRVQTELVPYQRGFLRRTTARRADGAWLVVVLWASEADAEAASARAAGHPLAEAFRTLLDGASVRLERYTTLD